jgi:hypothetical protein
MGYADIDKLAINTIRVLAVSSTPLSVLNYPSIRPKASYSSTRPLPAQR